ncbi:MAG: hypothetical protein AAB873_00060 [Patescibacteria group bacterium]
MKIITIDLKGIERLGQVWQKFATPFNFPDDQKNYNITFPDSKIILPPRELQTDLAWDAFWEYFRNSVYDMTENDQEVKLIIKNVSELKKFGLICANSKNTDTHYKVFLDILNDANKPEKIWANPEGKHKMNFMYELVEEK